MRDISEVPRFVSEVFGRFHRPHQVERRGRELEGVSILDYKAHPAVNSGLGRALSCQSCLFWADGESYSSAGKQPREVIVEALKRFDL